MNSGLEKQAISASANASNAFDGTEKIVGNILSLGSGEILSRSIAFAGTAYLARKLDPAGFGIIGFATALFSYFYFTGAIVFNDVGPREVARRPQDAQSIAASVILVRLAIGVVAMAVLSTIAWWLDKPVTVKLVVILTGLSFFSLAFDTSWVYKGLERSRLAGLALILGQALYLGVIFLSVRGPADITRVPIAQCIGEIGAALLLAVPLFRQGGVRLGWREGWNIIRVSWALFLTRVLRTLILPFNVLLIGFLLGEREVGLYTAPYRICFLFLSLAMALQVSYLPAVTRAASQGANQVAAMTERAIYLAVTMAAPMVVGVMVVTAPIVKTVFGASFLEGAVPFRFLVISIGCVFIYNAVRNVLLAYDLLRVELVIMAISAGLNIGLNPVVIPRYGLVGAAAVTVLSDGVILLLGLFTISRLGVALDWRPVWRPWLAAGVMGVSLLALGPDWPLVLYLIVGFIIYSSTLFLCRGLPDEIRPHLWNEKGSA